QHLGQSLSLGLQALHTLFRFRQRRARSVHLGARHVVRGFGGNCCSFRLGERGLRTLEDSDERTAIGGRQRRQLTLNGLDFGRNPSHALLFLPPRILQNPPPPRP